MILGKKFLKRGWLSLFACLFVFLFATPMVHAEETTPEDLSKFSQTVYEDLYAKDGNMKSYGMLGPSASYWVDNQYALGQNVQLVLICEKDPFLPSSYFKYEFTGTMDVNKQYCDLGFCFDFGLLGNKKVSSEVELKNGSKVDIREYQFAIYPGYYNFCNEGMETNDMKIGATNAILIKTFSPNFNKFTGVGRDTYPKSFRTEVTPKKSVRVYAVCGSPAWIEANESDIAAWAIQTEKDISENMAGREATQDAETVEVTPNTDKVVDEIKDSKVQVEEKTKVQEKFKDKKEVKESPSYLPQILKIVILFTMIVVGIFFGKKFYRNYKKSQY